MVIHRTQINAPECGRGMEVTKMAVYGYCWEESDKSKRGSVYFIRDGIGNIKIGIVFVP
jgi:hypothetical protein